MQFKLALLRFKAEMSRREADKNRPQSRKRRVAVEPVSRRRDWKSHRWTNKSLREARKVEKKLVQSE